MRSFSPRAWGNARQGTDRGGGTEPVELWGRPGPSPATGPRPPCQLWARRLSPPPPDGVPRKGPGFCRGVPPRSWKSWTASQMEPNPSLVAHKLLAASSTRRRPPGGRRTLFRAPSLLLVSELNCPEGPWHSLFRPRYSAGEEPPPFLDQSDPPMTGQRSPSGPEVLGRNVPAGRDPRKIQRQAMGIRLPGRAWRCSSSRSQSSGPWQHLAPPRRTC